MDADVSRSGWARATADRSSGGAGRLSEDGISGEVGIRQADARDVEALTALARETYATAFGHSMSPADLTAHLSKHLSRGSLERMLAEDTFLVAETGDRMVGFAQFGRAYDSDDGMSGADRELRRLYVHANFQNRGIGGRLMEAALAHADIKGARRIFLDVWEHNAAAQRFYARYGFEVFGATHFSVESGAETSLDWIMVRRQTESKGRVGAVADSCI